MHSLLSHNFSSSSSQLMMWEDGAVTDLTRVLPSMELPSVMRESVTTESRTEELVITMEFRIFDLNALEPVSRYE